METVRERILRHLTTEPTYPYELQGSIFDEMKSKNLEFIGAESITREVRRMHNDGLTMKLPKQEGRNQHPIRLIK